MSDKIEGALAALKHLQQIDEDGVMVGVSREALDVILSHLSALIAENEALKGNPIKCCGKDSDCQQALPVEASEESWRETMSEHNHAHKLFVDSCQKCLEDWKFRPALHANHKEHQDYCINCWRDMAATCKIAIEKLTDALKKDESELSLLRSKLEAMGKVVSEARRYNHPSIDAPIIRALAALDAWEKENKI